MGMGDKPQAFSPTHKTRTDAVSRLPFADISLRKCPHPAVQARYGQGCMVSVYTCKRCQYGQKHEFMDGWTCNYSTAETK